MKKNNLMESAKLVAELFVKHHKQINIKGKEKEKYIADLQVTLYGFTKLNQNSK